MTDTTLPLVSVLTAAYNYEHFVTDALESALQQDYPAERVELVVVDDGSTDRTADVVRALADRHPDRVTLVQQENAGKNSAIARAREHARGDLLALLDADDVWFPSKLRRQVDLMRRHPEFGLVFCDMKVVDSGRRVLKQSLYQPGEFDLDHMYARILQSNVAYSSSILVRPELVLAWPEEIEDCDWWITLCAAERAKLGYIPEPLALYRQHGSNVLNGATGESLIPLRRRQLRFQLWAFRHMSIEPLRPADLLQIWSGPEYFVGTAKQAVNSHFVDLVEISDAERAQARGLREQAQRALDAGDRGSAARLFFRALAWDPFEPDALPLLREAIVGAPQPASSS